MFNSASGGGGATPSSETPSDAAGIRRQFWITFTAISGATYIIAGLMMLGTAVPGEKWARIVHKGKAKVAAAKAKMISKGTLQSEDSAPEDGHDGELSWHQKAELIKLLVKDVVIKDVVIKDVVSAAVMVKAAVKAKARAKAKAVLKGKPRSEKVQDDASWGWKRFWHRKVAPQARSAETDENVV